MASLPDRSGSRSDGESQEMASIGAAAHPLGNKLVLAALATSPLMYLIELVGPEWIVYVLRASWVALVAVAAVVIVRERRALRRPR